ncbi:MAG: hypothetical protein ACFHHU_12075 [Porticoccaceae bacterium]
MKKNANICTTRIQKKSLAWSIAEASVAGFDQLNILHASMLAMKRAVESLDILPTLVLVDGNRNPDISVAVPGHCRW